MLVFQTPSDITGYIYNLVDTEGSISVIANYDIIIDVMADLLLDKDMCLEYCEINRYEYFKEFLLNVSVDIEGSGTYKVSVQPAYSEITERYYGSCAHVIVHEDVNSKCAINLQNHPYVPLDFMDWFVVGPTEDYELDETTEVWNEQASMSYFKVINDNDEEIGMMVLRN